MASPRVVLPDPPWPSSTMLRKSSGLDTGIAFSWRFAHPPARRQGLRSRRDFVDSASEGRADPPDGDNEDRSEYNHSPEKSKGKFWAAQRRSRLREAPSGKPMPARR